jgi:hypothetical protein
VFTARYEKSSFRISEVRFRVNYSLVTAYAASFNTKCLNFAGSVYLRDPYNLQQ